MKPILATIALLLAVNGMLHGQAVRTCTPQDWSGCDWSGCVAGGVPKCDPYIRNKDGWIIGQADCAAVVSGCIHAQTKPSKKSDGSVMEQASLAVAKNVCAATDGASVWIYNDKHWDVYPCDKLGPVFAMDKNNPFDDMIPLMQEVRDASADNLVKKKPGSQPPNDCGEGMHWAEKEHDKYGSHWICEKDAKP